MVGSAQTADRESPQKLVWPVAFVTFHKSLTEEVMISLALFSDTSTRRGTEPLIQDELPAVICVWLQYTYWPEIRAQHVHRVLGSEKEWKLIVPLAHHFAWSSSPFWKLLYFNKAPILVSTFHFGPLSVRVLK